MNPQSHFPYSLLGEIYIRLDDWENAVVTLKNALSMAYAKETANNLGVAWYHAGNYVGAAECFGKCAGDSDYSLYSQAMCYAKLGKDEDAIRILRAFDEQADDFVGEIELAELYAELHQFSEALAWYGKGWKIYYKSMDWVRRYMYVLLSTGNDERARACIQTVMDEKTEAINEAALEQADDDWTEADKQHYLLELHNDRLELDQMIPALRNVSLPPAEFHTSIQTRCYLFGCERHGNPVYDDRR